MKPRVKVVWAIKATEAGTFYIVDDHGKTHGQPVTKHLRPRLSDIAFEHGADEVLHDYDLVKHDS